jgi:hypothetical protein
MKSLTKYDVCCSATRANILQWKISANIARKTGRENILRKYGKIDQIFMDSSAGVGGGGSG